MVDFGAPGGKEERKPAPQWRLIAILGSTFPLSEALSRWLYETAVDLHRDGAAQTRIAGDLGEGVVINLQQDVLVGSLGGPSFRAELDTPKGRGQVRFLVTREGLEARAEAERRRRALN